MSLIGVIAAGFIGKAVYSAVKESRESREFQAFRHQVDTMFPSRREVVYVEQPREIVYVERDSHGEKVAFLDSYRRLDCMLARMIHKEWGGITPLIDQIKYGLDNRFFSQNDAREAKDLYKHLRTVRHIRNALCHSEMAWQDIPNPSITCTKFVNAMLEWVDGNDAVYRLMNANSSSRYYLK